MVQVGVPEVIRFVEDADDATGVIARRLGLCRPEVGLGGVVILPSAALRRPVDAALPFAKILDNRT